MRADVIIPARDEEGSIGRVVESLPPAHVARVIVVDNRSTDGSVGRLRAGFPGVEVLALTENRRFAGGRRGDR